MITTKKGFTLIELLIVIGILAVLATAAILVLNPARLFAEARDSQRISDFTALKNAMELYLATVSSPAMATPATDCGTKWWATVAATVQPFALPVTPVAATLPAAADLLKTSGAGWVRVDLGSLPDGSPLAALPKDPRNTGTGSLATDGGMFYAYACKDSGATKQYELNTRMESARYAKTGADSVEDRDGGTSDDIYEIGNALGL